ncbi:CPBP family glutamic-type intramembrane protease [Sediminitomix flava]|uniref:ABC-type Na+ efflux pump permease subunit n=1 Tax=Sediminitomix flava TaxID=379075 RepID=A0A315ZCQ9_SEDFL|nr:CPBP family glutamic-type intramembrane protease [Sediminitomix flava]PWJ42883.1 ABC-type Na+ efflux pump permease subunit [Sediminitomix flava]
MKASKFIFQKDLLEIKRDKKMLFLSLLLPMLMYPMIFLLMGIVQQADQPKKNDIKVVLPLALENTALADSLKKIEILEPKFVEKSEINFDSLGSTIAIDRTVKIDSNQVESYSYKLYYDNTLGKLDDAVHKEIKPLFKELNKQVAKERLASLNLTDDFLNPVKHESVTPKSDKEGLFLKIVQFIPAYFLFFILIGTSGVAVDLISGEKERKTLQTLFTAPIQVMDLIWGKFMSISTVATGAAIANLTGLFVGVTIQMSVLGANTSKIPINIGLEQILLMLPILILAASLISAVYIALLVQANTFKEAQSYMGPIMMIFMVPMFLVGNLDWNMMTTAIPIMGPLLAMKEIVLGHMDWSLWIITMLFQVFYVGLAIYFAQLVFMNEGIVSGEKLNFKSMVQDVKKDTGHIGMQYALLFFGVALFIMVYGSALLFKSLDAKYALPTVQLVTFGGLTILFTKWLKLEMKPTLSLNKPKLKEVIGTLFMAVGFFFPIAAFVTYLFDDYVMMSPELMTDFFEKESLIVLLLVIAVTPAIFEELAFRGFIYKGILQSFGPKVAIVISALMFAFFHGNLFQLPATILIGLVTGYMIWKTRSLYLTVLYHFIHNGLAVVSSKLGKNEVAVYLESQQLFFIVGGLLFGAFGLWLVSSRKNTEQLAEDKVEKPEEEVLEIG